MTKWKFEYKYRLSDFLKFYFFCSTIYDRRSKIKNKGQELFLNQQRKLRKRLQECYRNLFEAKKIKHRIYADIRIKSMSDADSEIKK